MNDPTRSRVRAPLARSTRRVVFTALLLGAGPPALAAQGYVDPETCAGYGRRAQGHIGAYCKGYNENARVCIDLLEETDRESCDLGAHMRRSHDTSAANERQFADNDRERRALLKTAPLPAGANPLLGQWRRVGSRAPERGRVEGLAAGLTETVCMQVQGAGPSFEFRADALAHGGRPVSAMQYRAGPDGVVYAFGDREPLRQLAWRFQSRDRITLANCAYERVGAAQTASTRDATTRDAASPARDGRAVALASASVRPPPTVCRNTMVDRLGAVRVDEVRQMIKARFRETLPGTVPSSQNLRLDARGSACDDPRINAMLYDFDAAGVLQAVTVVWARPPGPAPAPLFSERATLLARVFGLPVPTSPSRLAGRTAMARIVLEDRPERELLLEAYSAPR